MPAPQKTDYFTQALQQIYNLLWASAFIKSTFPAKAPANVPGNFYAYIDGRRWPDKPASRSAAELPELVLDIDSWRTTSDNLMPTFCNTRGKSGDRVVVQEIVYRGTLTTPGLDLVLPNQILTEWNTVLLDDPKLGLSYVQRTNRASFRDPQGRSKQRDKSNNRVREILFPVIFALHRADLFPD